MSDDNKKAPEVEEQAKKEESSPANATEDKKEQAASPEAEKKEEKVEVKEEVKAEAKSEPKAEAKATEEPKEKKESSVKLSSKLEKIAKELEGLTVLEMSELASYLEDKFGVSAMPVAAAGGPAAGAAAGGDGAPAEEKSSYNVVLTASGDNKLAAIKALREFRQDLGLMDAKKMVETAPQTVLENVKKEEAEEAQKKLEGAGAKVELK